MENEQLKKQVCKNEFLFRPDGRLLKVRQELKRLTKRRVNQQNMFVKFDVGIKIVTMYNY